LVELLRSGSDFGKEHAASTLADLAVARDLPGNVDIATAIVAAGALPPLVELLRSGSNYSKAMAARTLGVLARYNDVTTAVMAAGPLPLLVDLLSGGSDEGMAMAMAALMVLAYDDANKTAVVAAGAILPMVELLRFRGSAGARRNAASALYVLSSIDAGRHQVERLDFTRDQLRELREIREHAPMWILLQGCQV
jgi:vacuolar protein 8